MKILMLGWELPPSITGGLGSACEGMLSAMAKRGDVCTTFVLPKIEGAHFLEAPHTRVIQIEARPENCVPCATSGESSYSTSGVLKQRAIAFANGVTSGISQLGCVDVIHAHDWMTFLAASRLKQLTGRKVVAHVHSTEYDRAGTHQVDRDILAAELEGLTGADKIVTVSEYTKNILVKGYGQDVSKIEVVPNGAKPQHLNLFGHQEIREECLVTYLGRVTYQKGPESFIEAARLIRSDIPSAKFVMAGEGDLMPMAKSWVRASGMKDIFSFPGFLDEQRKLQLLRRSSVFIMPSVSEPFGIAALEAINADVPVVISRQSGIIERIKHVITVDPFDVVAIASAAINLLVNRSHAASLAKAARREASKLTWEATASQLIGLYMRIIN